MSNLFKIIVLVACLTSFLNAYSQIGIGTTDPQPETLLDVESLDKGILVPRIFIDDFETYTLPSGNLSESLLLYNTNSTLGKGFVLWNGSRWAHLNSNHFWSTYGDREVSASQFIGTIDSRAFVIGTNGLSRLNIGLNAQLASNYTSNVSNPAWSIGTTSGMNGSSDELNFAIAGGNIWNVSHSTGSTFNYSQNNVDFKINGTSGVVVQLEGDTNRMGILPTSSIESTLHVQGATSNVQIESLGSSNANNNGVDKSLLYVDDHGEFKLESTPHITQLPAFEYETGYLSTSLLASSSNLGEVSGIIYSTTEDLYEDGLLEVVYQTSFSLRNTAGGAISDGLPRLYGIRILVNGRVIGKTAKMYTATGSGSSVASGFMYLNGKGYVPLTGSSAGTTYTIDVEVFVDGGGNDTQIAIGSSTHDLFEVIVHY